MSRRRLPGGRVEEIPAAEEAKRAQEHAELVARGLEIAEFHQLRAKLTDEVALGDPVNAQERARLRALLAKYGRQTPGDRVNPA